ncbi:MAG: TonB-dependent receptor, partial [Odoribacter sp.]|nr:TonB-dependent receptor [Odoribacter sp.]
RTYKYCMGDYYQQWYGAYLMALGNKDLKWQQTGSMNIGFETRFWNSRAYAEFNYYKKVTDNLLSSRDLPLSNGFSSYTENVGKVQNTGFEVKASVQVIRDTEREIIWSLTGSMMLNKNKLVKISDALKKASDELALEGGTDPNYLYREGKSMNAIYVVPSLGIDPSNGKELFLNRFGEKTYTWDARDMIDCGINEKYRGNISTNFRYKSLSANIVFGYRLGGQLYNSTLINRVENADIMYNVDRRVYEDRWMKPGDKTFYKGINETGTTQMSSRFVQNENTFECQNINLTYDLRHKWLSSNLGLNLLSFQCDMGDIFRISSVKQERGINYPFSRKVSFTLSATF